MLGMAGRGIGMIGERCPWVFAMGEAVSLFLLSFFSFFSFPLL